MGETTTFVVKLIAQNINRTVGLLSVFLVCVAIYFLFGNWGDVSKNFFLGLGVTFIFFGICIGEVAALGHMGISNKQVAGTFWSGNRILLLYLTIVTIGAAACIWSLNYVARKVVSLKAIYGELREGEVGVSLDPFEVQVAEKFNQFFFGITSVCGHLNTIWFWTFVANYCPAEMQRGSCERCGDFWITWCSVNQAMCYRDYDVLTGGYETAAGEHETCPYIRCRTGILRYFFIRVSRVEWGLGLLLFLFVLQAFLVAIIMCASGNSSGAVSASSPSEPWSMTRTQPSHSANSSDKTNSAWSKGRSEPRSFVEEQTAQIIAYHRIQQQNAAGGGGTPAPTRMKAADGAYSNGNGNSSVIGSGTNSTDRSVTDASNRANRAMVLRSRTDHAADVAVDANL